MGRKHVLFLPDGMADEPQESLGGRTPLEAAATPNLDRLARGGHARFGTFRSLPDGYPTSSDVANLSVLGYDLATVYQGRGPLEAASRGILLGDDEIAMRASLVTVGADGRLVDYSAGQIAQSESTQLIEALNDAFGNHAIRFAPGLSYRNLLIVRGSEHSPDFHYEKPDDHQGDLVEEHLPRPRGAASETTAALARRLMLESRRVLSEHPVNVERVRRGAAPANMVWLWSPGRRPRMPTFAQKYGVRGAIVSAVDVIRGIGVLAGMEVLDVEGATGYIDTNYEGKARAAAAALDRCDFVYLHTEATDEVSHAGNLELKLQAIEDFDRRVLGTFLDEIDPRHELAIAVLPDHPVPVALRRHTRVPVPVMIVRPDWNGDAGDLLYGERDSAGGSLGLMRGDGVMSRLLGS